MQEQIKRFNRRNFLTRSAAAVSGLAALGGIGAPWAAGALRPNVVLIVIDDFGWADLGSYGSSFYETPNVDRLAAEGLRFTQAYASCPVCSPTRASIMTGKYPARLGLTDFLKGRRSPKESSVLPADYLDQLPLEEVTVAEHLRAAGYRTCHVGKWHLGKEGFWPQDQGFDVNIGGAYAGAPKSYFWPEWKGNPPVEGNFEGEYLTDLLTERACEFIREEHVAPFFLYLAHYSVHIPLQPKPEALAKYEKKRNALPEAQPGQANAYYAAMVESIDESVGRVMTALQENGLENDTLVLFTSDNGGLAVEEGKHTPATSNAPLRAGKGYLYEGGIRVPLIARWRNHIPAGSMNDTCAISNDFLPTLSELAGQPAKAMDGQSLTPLFAAGGSLPERDLFWHYPHFSNQGGRPGGAIRRGDWKLIEWYETGGLELYNLRDDLGEIRNLAREHPERAAELRNALHAWRQEVKANMPRPNPNYTAGLSDARPSL